MVQARDRYTKGQALKAGGKHIAAITRELRLAPGTTRHWNSGCTNVQQLHREVTELGFRGGYGTPSHPGPRREYAQ